MTLLVSDISWLSSRTLMTDCSTLVVPVVPSPKRSIGMPSSALLFADDSVLVHYETGDAYDQTSEGIGARRCIGNTMTVDSAFLLTLEVGDSNPSFSFCSVSEQGVCVSTHMCFFRAKVVGGIPKKYRGNAANIVCAMTLDTATEHQHVCCVLRHDWRSFGGRPPAPERGSGRCMDPIARRWGGLCGSIGNCKSKLQ